MARKKYTFEECLENALKHETRKSWYKNDSKFYEIAKKRKWLIDCTKHMKAVPRYRYWTKEVCAEIANQYQTKKDFKENDPNCYAAAESYKFLNEICSHMIPFRKPNGYWNDKELCKQAALTCQTRSEFCKNYKTAALNVRKNGWSDILSHMKIAESRNKPRMIYAYEFPDNSVYVGLTYKEKERKTTHLTLEQNSRNSAVKKHIKKTNLEPIYKKISDYIDAESSQKLEGDTVHQYRESGWNILNEKETGGLGGTTVIWTKDKCKSIALQYNEMKLFRKQEANCYDICQKNGWKEEILGHLKYKNNPPGYWTKERCHEAALLFTSRNEFQQNSVGYGQALRKHWIDDICSHMSQYGTKTYDECRVKAAECKNRSDFKIKFSGFYQWSNKHKWLDNFFHKKKTTPNKPAGYWDDLDLCKQEASRFKNVTEWKKNSSGSFKAAKRNGWIDICMEKNKN